MVVLPLLAGALFGISARCLEHDSLRMGPDLKWHIYGEIVNETDVQGSEIALSGAVFDRSGRRLGTGEAIMCPSSLSPGTFSVYDIAIAIPPTSSPPDSHKVNVKSGKATSERLPVLLGTFREPVAEVFRDGGGRSGIIYSTTFALPESDRFLLLPGQTLPQFTYCVAMYSADGAVVALIPPVSVRSGFAEVLLTSKISTGTLQFESDSRPVPDDAVEIRFLAWLVTEDGVPSTAVAISPPTTIVRH